MSTASAELASRPPDNSRSILDSIRPFRRRMLGLSVAQSCLTIAAVLLLGMLFALWFDTVWALPATLRWAISRGGILTAGIACGLAAWGCGRRTTASRVAQDIDRSIASGGEVLAGLQLATQPVHPGTELSQGFASLAAGRAVQLVQTLTPEVVSDWSGLKKASVLMGATVCIAFSIGAIVPGIAMHQFQRFLFPSQDIPPYTGVEIELELERDSVLYGQDVFVTAHVRRGRVADMMLIVRTDDAEEQSLPMLADAEGRWQAVLTRVTEPLSLYARSDHSRSKMRRLEVQMTPQILPPKVTVTPPAYTRLSVYHGVLPEQGLAGLVGTDVSWEISSNRPLREGTLELTFRDATTATLALWPEKDGEAPHIVRGTMPLTKPGQFALSVTDIDGLKSHDTITGSITIVDDRRPVVRITSPQQQSLATPDVTLPVTVMAEDDFGISSLTLFRSLNGSPATQIAAEVDGSPRMQHVWQFPLASYGLEPGDEIRLFARTEDNDPAGAKGAESQVTVIQIISKQQFQEMMLQRRGAESIAAKYQEARRQFDRLSAALREVENAQAELDAEPASSEAAQKLQDALNAAQQTAHEAAQEIEQLSQEPLPIDVDQELAKRLAEMSEQAREMASSLQQMQQEATPSLSESDKSKLQEMRQKSGDLQRQLTEQAIEPLKQLQQIMPLVTDQMRFTQLAQQQRDLAERLSGLEKRNPQDEASQRRVAELEAEQEQLKQQLAQLLDDIERHANELPDDPEIDQLKTTALEFVREVRASEASQEMSSAQENLLGDQFADAQKNAENAAAILESVLSQCQGMGGEATSQCKAAFNPSTGGPGLGNSIEQMLQMMGMKPGSSMNPGGNPGMGMGWGAGGGYAQRFPGPQNVGMYGSLPIAQASPSRGQGERQSLGVSTSQVEDRQGTGDQQSDVAPTGEAAGAAMNALPADYRAKVAEYFRSLSTAVNEAENP